MLKVLRVVALVFSILGLFISSSVLAATGCPKAVGIETDWEQVICPDSEFERTVTKSGSHQIGYTTPGCESGSTASSGGTVPQPPSSGGGTGGGGTQSGSGGSFSGGTTTLLGDDACPTLPPKEGYDNEEDCEVCTGSSVLMSMGSYQTSDTDLSIPARPFPVVWDRYYRSNAIAGKSGTQVSISSRCVDSDNLINPVQWQSAESYSSSSPAYSPPEQTPLGRWHNLFLTTARKYTLVHSYERYLNGECVDLSYTENYVQYVDERGRQIKISSASNGVYEPSLKQGISVVETGEGLEVRKKDGTSQFYGSDGRLLEVRNALGQSLKLAYDDLSRLIAVKDNNGLAVLTLDYEGEGTLIQSVTDNAGRVVWYSYDLEKRLSKVTNPAGKETDYTYNTYHGLTSKTNPLGEAVTIKYAKPESGIVEEVIDPVGTELMREGRDYSGHTKTFALDFASRIYYFTDENGNQFKRITDGQGRLVSEVEMAGGATVRKVEYPNEREEIHADAAGNTRHIYKDEWENIKKVVDGEGNVTTITWNTKNRPLSITDALGVQTTFAYDSTGTLLTQKVQAKGAPEQVITTYTYTTYGELETVTTDGATTSITYNSQGQPVSFTDPLGSISRLEYDASGNITAVVGAENNRTTFTYDDLGNPLSVIDPLGNKTSMAYNAAGRLTQVTDALDRVTKFETDYKDRILAVIDALNQRKEFTYDGVGNLTAIAEGDAVTRMTYDSSKRLTSVTDPEGITTTYSYSAAGCSSCGGSNDIPEEVIDPFGNMTKNLFDKNGQLKGVEDPLKNLTTVTRDAVGRVASQIDGNGNVTSFEYDALGRLIRQIDAEGGITSFSYNKRGDLTSLTDAENNTTRFEYDLTGRKTKEIRPMGQVAEYTYYKNGLLKTVKDAKQQISTYTYDAANRLIDITYADSTKDTFSYDAVGNMISYANQDVSGTLTFDKLNRKLSETVDYGPFQKSFSYTYDVRGNKATYTSPEAITHTYTYRKNDQLKTISVDGKTFTFSYEKDRLKQLVFPNGVTTDYSYNANAWLTNITTIGPLGTILTRNYNHDSVGNITTKNAEHGTYEYGYDKTYQLTRTDNPTFGDEAYTYDKVGNRKTSLDTTGSWSYNGNNELLSDTRASFEYDANGNTVKKAEVGQITRYEYNARNRLSKVYLPNGRQVIYAYDPFGRRIKKQIANTATYFTNADEGLVAEYSDQGINQKSYGWKPDSLWGTDPIYQTDGGQYYYYHNDHLLMPQQLTNRDGKVVWSILYASFGDIQISSPLKIIFNNLRFPGQYEDVETGNYYNFQRYYDAYIGRYLSSDLIGLKGGDNLYLYGGANPIDNFDFLGLNAEDAIRVWQNFVTNPDSLQYGIARQKTMWDRTLVYELPFIEQFKNRLLYQDSVGIDVSTYSYEKVACEYRKELKEQYLYMSAIAGFLSAGGYAANLEPYPTQVRASGAKHILESPTRLVVKEHHFKDLSKIFDVNKGQRNIFRGEFWKHVLPHRHVYETANPPKMLDNWRKAFQRSGASKTTKLGW